MDLLNLFKKTEDVIKEFTLENSKSFSVSVINYGASITKILCKDKEGQLGDVIMGFKDPEGYLQEENPYMNCMVGRVANRIKNASYFANGEIVHLSKNHGDHQLHGGMEGLSRKIWEVKNVEKDQITFVIKSRDGEEGYPGDVTIEVTYKVSDEDALHIACKATTNALTPINLTSHGYFNLSAGTEETIEHHELKIFSNDMLTYEEGLIPDGGFKNVKDTPFDFNQFVQLDAVLKRTGGLDHFWVLNEQGRHLKLVSELQHRPSGRMLKTFTTEPGLQVYTCNWEELEARGNKSDRPYPKHAGICIEAQIHPDAVNHPHFPNTFVNPGEIYHHETVYQFGLI
jgi:aldose 1-epimerase